jgi:hypothetical protein
VPSVPEVQVLKVRVLKVPARKVLVPMARVAVV